MIFAINNLFAEKYIIYKAKSGDALSTVLEKFFLPLNASNIEQFRELNKKKLTKDDGLFQGTVYRLPIVIKEYNNKDLSSSLGFSTDNTDKIEIYNKKVFTANLKGKPYKKDKKIWVPLIYLNRNNTVKTVNSEKISKTDKIIKKTEKSKESISKTSNSKNNQDYSIFGKKYSKIKVKNTKLSGRVFYIDPGHGGCDPGAIGKRNGHELHEDEYAYDVSLRLARYLIENGAKVYVIVIDPKDGIRDEDYLKPSYNEYYYGGDSISTNQKERLQKRADIINDLYKVNKKTSKSQTSVTIHLDSRFTEKRIDIFFYHMEGSEEGKALAEKLKETISRKYEIAQPGRGYKGSVSDRNLLMLRELSPVSVYIELGNIQNKNDQFRFIKYSNRQTIAKWLGDGLIEFYRVKK